MLRTIGRVRVSPSAIHAVAKRAYGLSTNDAKKKLGIVGLPFSGGQPNDGVDLGVQHIRDAGIASQLTELGWTIDDRGDVRPPGENQREPRVQGYRNSKIVGEMNRLAYEAVRASAKQNDVTLAIGGDHSLAVGTIAGNAAARPDQVVLWIDAHGDINDGVISPTGNIHGMPLSFLTGLVDPKSVAGFEWLTPCLNPRDLVYIGLRDVDQSEKVVLRNNNIRCITMHDVDHHGIKDVVKMALDHVDPYRSRPIHVSYDIDAGDPSVCPSTGTRVPGGLTFRELMYVSESIYATGQISSFDLVEVNPKLGSEKDVKQTVNTACSVIRAAFGETLI